MGHDVCCSVLVNDGTFNARVHINNIADVYRLFQLNSLEVEEMDDAVVRVGRVHFTQVANPT